jgi:addiction module HigA family antidote
MRQKFKSKPVSPGEILSEEFLKPLKITQREFAECINVDVKVVNRLINSRTSVTPELAVKLFLALGPSPEFWLNAQMAIDLWELDEQDFDIKRIKSKIA